jgi:hypothetical protein
VLIEVVASSASWSLLIIVGLKVGIEASLVLVSLLEITPIVLVEVVATSAKAILAILVEIVALVVWLLEVVVVVRSVEVLVVVIASIIVWSGIGVTTCSSALGLETLVVIVPLLVAIIEVSIAVIVVPVATIEVVVVAASVATIVLVLFWVASAPPSSIEVLTSTILVVVTPAILVEASTSILEVVLRLSFFLGSLHSVDLLDLANRDKFKFWFLLGTLALLLVRNIFILFGFHLLLLEFLDLGFQEEIGLLQILDVLVLHLIDANCLLKVKLSGFSMCDDIL